MQQLISKIYGPFADGRVALGLLLLRLIIGGAFMMHGWSKIQSPFGWMGPDSPVPSIFQGLAALSEFGGGLALILGFLTPLGALGIASTMAVAYKLAHSADPWIGMGKSYEIVALYFVAAISLIFTGPGKFSLDAILFNRNKR